MHQPDPHEKPPLFKSWTTWYVGVIGFLIALIGIFYWMTRYFSH